MFDNGIVFKLKRGNVTVSGIRRREVVVVVQRFVKDHPTVSDFEAIKKTLDNLLVKYKKLGEEIIVQIIGDKDWNAYVDVYIAQKEVCTSKIYRSTSRLPIEKLWREYNDEITKIFKKGKLPESDISRGYNWFSEKSIQKVQEKVLAFCQRHSDKIILISQYDEDPYKRGVANAFLRFVNPKNGVKALHKATKDRDHFAHNMAWQSLGVKLDKLGNSKKTLRVLLMGACELLAHPSTICKNKALLTILYFKEHNFLPEKISPRIYNLIKVASRFRNPIIHEPARTIIKMPFVLFKKRILPRRVCW